jgi:trans-aconitate methyltransferase
MPGDKRSFQHSWDAQRYDREFGFVAQYGRELLELLSPQESEHIIDLGCGTGELTAEIAARGAHVIGIDSDPGMIERARQRLGDRARIGNGNDFEVEEPVDAVFSNAALHWMTNPSAVALCVRKALKPDGRFVAEMGGHRNIATIIESVRDSLAMHGFDTHFQLPTYFPRPSEYAGVLESAGFDVAYMRYFSRPTPLRECRNGISDWVEMFHPEALTGVPEDSQKDVLASVNELARPRLFHDNVWVADYWRLRFVAVPSDPRPLGPSHWENSRS